MSSLTYSDYSYEQGKARVKRPVIQDGFDEMDPEERQEIIVSEIRREAIKLREARARVAQRDSEGDTEETSVLQASRPIHGFKTMDDRKKFARDKALASGKINPDEEVKFLDDVDLVALAEGDEAFLDILNMMKNDTTGEFDGVEVEGKVFRHAHERQMARAEKKNETRESTETGIKGSAEKLALAKFADLSAPKFMDPSRWSG